MVDFSGMWWFVFWVGFMVDPGGFVAIFWVGSVVDPGGSVAIYGDLLSWVVAAAVADPSTPAIVVFVGGGFFSLSWYGGEIFSYGGFFLGTTVGFTTVSSVVVGLWVFGFKLLWW